MADSGSAGVSAPPTGHAAQPESASGPTPQAATEAVVDAAPVPASDPIVIFDPDPRWPARYERAADEIRSTLGDLLVDIEHVGSTAIPGLAAKPIIDIQVGLASLDHDATAVVDALTGLGYDYVPELKAGFANRRFFRRMTEGRRTHQVHVVARDDLDWWDRHLTFRDWLRTHPDDRDRYGDLKRQLAERHRDDRAAYTDAKSAFVDVIVAQAMASRPPEEELA